MNEINIWTDGACSTKTKRGGWAYYSTLSQSDSSEVLFRVKSGNLENTTNNIMELTAVISALSMLHPETLEKVIVHSDSKYVVDGVTKWIFTWRTNNWKTSNNKDVKNKSLWQLLFEKISFLNVEFRWHPRNSTRQLEMVDGLAKYESNPSLDGR